MLNELERRLTALVGDALAVRTHLDVVQAPAAGPPDPGEGQVEVALVDVAPVDGFERSRIAFLGTPDAPSSRVVLPLTFRARLGFSVRRGGQVDDLPSARSLLLEDLSIAGHVLAAPAVRDGSAFRTEGVDAGFDVRCFELRRSSVEPDGETATLRAQLSYGGEASIWPVTPPGPEGVIRRQDTVIAPLPIEIAVDPPAVRAGDTARLRIEGIDARRLVDLEPDARAAAALALRVVSDLPPAQRGVILSGADGAETGVRIVQLTGPPAIVEYRAPSGNLGSTRLESVAVHLATADGAVGALLGSATVRLLAEGP
jgi:hypothetical protein